MPFQPPQEGIGRCLRSFYLMKVCNQILKKVSAMVLRYYLSLFFGNLYVCMGKGSEIFGASSLICIRASIHRHLTSLDIYNNYNVWYHKWDQILWLRHTWFRTRWSKKKKFLKGFFFQFLKPSGVSAAEYRICKSFHMGCHSWNKNTVRHPHSWQESDFFLRSKFSRLRENFTKSYDTGIVLNMETILNRRDVSKSTVPECYLPKVFSGSFVSHTADRRVLLIWRHQCQRCSKFHPK